MVEPRNRFKQQSALDRHSAIRCVNLFDKKIARLIKATRIEKGITLDGLARKIGVSHQQLQKYEAAKNRIPSGRLFSVALALDLSLDSLLSEAKEFVDRPQE